MLRRSRRRRPPLDVATLTASVALGWLLVAAAIAGEPVAVLGVEVPLAGDPVLRAVVGACGVLVLLAAGAVWWWRRGGRRPVEVVNLPLRHPGFVGRRAELERIRRQLTTVGGQDEPALVVVQGPGGAGKTQLALEYAHQHRRRYDVVWWIPAERLPVVADRFSTLAVLLGVATTAGDRGAVAAATTALRGFDRWLLIFDDPPDPIVLGGLLPSGGAGHILVTTRDPAWSQRATAVTTVDGLARPDAVDLVCARTGTRDRDLAAALAAEVGDLPLALEQGTAYLRSTGLAAERYLRVLRERPRAALQRGTSGHYPRSLVAVHDLAVERVDRDDPSALDLLRLYAFLAPDTIPLDLATGAVTAPAGDPPELRHGDAVAALARAALVTVRRSDAADADRAELAVHRLTQALIRDGMDPGERRRWSEVAVET
ncbi:MAG: NB-ARC domain-containing protein, partial [Actinoplanes sp.]